MSVQEMVSTLLLLLGVVLGPTIFLTTIIGYSLSKAIALIADYREQHYLRSLPCSKCQYFINNEFLPCAINPLQALTEASRSCHDFSPNAIASHTYDGCSRLRTLTNPEFVKNVTVDT